MRAAVGFQLASSRDIGLGDVFAIAIAQNGFQHNANGDGQLGDGADARFFQRRQGIKGTFGPLPRSNFWRELNKLCVVHLCGRHAGCAGSRRRKMELGPQTSSEGLTQGHPDEKTDFSCAPDGFEAD